MPSFFELTLGVRTSRDLLQTFGSGSATEIITLARLKSIPLLGGIAAALSHCELIRILAQFLAIVFLADLGTTTLVAVGGLAVGDFGDIEHLSIAALVLGESVQGVFQTQVVCMTDIYAHLFLLIVFH